MLRHQHHEQDRAALTQMRDELILDRLGALNSRARSESILRNEGGELTEIVYDDASFSNPRYFLRIRVDSRVSQLAKTFEKGQIRVKILHRRYRVTLHLHPDRVGVQLLAENHL